MMRIGIFGGTFNPIHSGHLIIAQEVLEQLKLDRIIFVPCFLPPHKIERKLAKANDRLKMVSLAVRSNRHFKVSGWEIKQKGISYTVDTVKHFNNLFRDKASLFFIIGADNLKDLNRWKDSKAIMKLAKMVVVNRPGQSLKNLRKEFIPVLIPGIDIASSLIRRRISQKRGIDYFLPSNVKAYIKKRRLYI